MDIDDTQVLTLSEGSSNSDEDNKSNKEKKLVAHLKVRRQKELPETLYPVYEGETVIGRDPERCNIHIPVKALSKIHACIVVTGKNHIIYDKNSRNRTRKGKVYLEPDVRYNLEDGDCITFADIKCSYIYMKAQCDDDDATDSNLGDSSLKFPNNNDKPTQDESVHYELDEDELSSDILQPTQADALPSTLCHQSQATQLYVAESDEDKAASSTEATDYIPDSDDEAEVNKDSNHMIQDPTIQHDLLTEEKRDNDNGEVSTNALANESSGQDKYSNIQSESIKNSELDVAAGTSTAGLKDPVTVTDTEACDLDLDATQCTGVDPEENQPAQVDVVPDSQSQMATQTFGQDNEQNRFVDKNEADIATGTTTACTKDPVTAMDTEAYDLNAKQSASLDPEMNQPAQVDVVPDSQSQMATQTFEADEDKEDDLSTQTFKIHSVEEHHPILNTECSTMAFNYNSSDDDDNVSAAFPNCHSGNNVGTRGTKTRNDSEMKTAIEFTSTTNKAEVDITKAVADTETVQMSEQTDDPQVFTEAGIPNSSEGSDSTKVLEDDNTQCYEKPDTTQVIEQPAESQTLVEVSAPKNPELSDKTQTVKDDSVIKHSETTDSTMLVTQGDNNTAQDKSSATQKLTEFNDLDDQDTSELYIAETQPSEQSETGFNVSQSSICDNSKSMIIAETPVGLVHHAALTKMDSEEPTQSFHVVTDKEVKSQDYTKVDAPNQNVSSQPPECDTISADATLLLDSECGNDTSHHVLNSASEGPESSSCDNTSSSNVMELKSLSPSAHIRTSTSSESFATSNTDKEQPADNQSLTVRSNEETENADSSIEVNEPLEDQESLCQDKLPGSTDDVQPEVPDKNDKAVENQQPFGDKTADDCADVKISEQPSPCNTDRQEVQGVRTYPRRKHLKRSESGKSKQIITMQEVPPVEGPDHGSVECKESAVTEVKSVKTARGRSKAKVASVNLGQDQKSKKAWKRGSLSAKSKLNEIFSSIKQCSKAEGQAKEKELEASEAALQTRGADSERQQEAAEKDDNGVVLLEPLHDEHVSQERTQDLTDSDKTALVDEVDEHMASTQAYGDEIDDLLETQPYDDHPVNLQLSPNVGDSPEIKKSRPKRNQQSLCRKDKRQTKTKKVAKKVSDVPDDDSQKDMYSKKAGTTANDVKQNTDNLQNRTTRSGSSQQTEPVALQGRRSGRLRKLFDQTKKPVEVFEDAVVLLERLNTEKYGCPVKTPASTCSYTASTEDEEMASTQAYGDDSDQVPNTQPDYEQPATEQLSLDNVKIRNVAKVRKSNRNQPSALRKLDEKMKRGKAVHRRSNVDEEFQNNKSTKSEGRKSTRTRRSQAEFNIENTNQTKSEPSHPKEHIAVCKTRKGSAKKVPVKKYRRGVTVEQTLPVPDIQIKQEICEDAVVLLERVDSSNSSFGEHSFITSNISHQKCLQSRSKKYSRLSLKKRNKGQTNVETCINDMDESHSPGHSRYTQLKDIKQEVGQNAGSAFLDKTRKRSSGRKIYRDNFITSDLEADNIPPTIKKPCTKQEMDECEQNTINVKTECVTAIGSIQLATEKTASRRKRSARKCGRSGEIHQDTSVKSAMSDIPDMLGSNVKNDACHLDNKLNIDSENDEFEPLKKKRVHRQKRGACKNTNITGTVSQSHLNHGMRANKQCSSTTNNASDKTAAVDRDQIEGVSMKASSEMAGESVSKKSSKQKRTSKRPKEVENECEAEQQTSRKKTKKTPKTPSTSRQKMSHELVAACSPNLRKRTLESKPKVMFTGVNENRAKKIVSSLGGTLVTSIAECTHLVTDKVRRTVKFLCAVAKGIPVVSPLWLDSCKTAGLFLDASNFLVEDRGSEKLYKFKLATSLKAASEHRMLDGYKIHVTPSVTPAVKDMKEIITCAGGELLATMPNAADANIVIVSCPKDQAKCKAARSRGVAIVTAEFLLTGILQQVVDIDAYRL